MKKILLRTILILFIIGLGLTLSSISRVFAAIDRHGSDTTFVQKIPISDYYVDYSKVNVTTPNTDAGGANQLNGKGFARTVNTFIYKTRDDSKLAQNTDNPLVNGNNATSSLYIIYRDAATLTDGTTADVRVVYSNLRIVTNNYTPSTNFNILESGTHIETTPTNGTNNSFRYALKGNIRVDVCKGATNATNGTIQNGTYHFATHGLNTGRQGTSFATGATAVPNASSNYYYSEQMNFGSATVTGNVYTPYDQVPSGTGSTYVTSIDGNILYAASSISIPNGNTSYFGGAAASFASGSTVSFMMTGGWNGSSMTTDFWIKPGDLSRKMSHATGNNGTIQTTRGTDLDSSNASGDLQDGTDILGPGHYGVPNYKAVTYTMTPDSGYKIKSLTVDGVDKTQDAQNNVVRNTDGSIKYYTYTINGDTSSHTTNVEWEKETVDCYFTKKWIPEESSSLNITAKPYTFDGSKFVAATGVSDVSFTVNSSTTSTDKYELEKSGDQWKIKIKSLQPDIYWFVTETNPSGYTGTYDNSGVINTTVKNASTLPDGVYASEKKDEGGVITNTLYKKIIINKKVTGNMSRTDKSFSYTFNTNSSSSMKITITASNGTTTTSSIASGGTFSLKHGETATIENIIKGSTYTITENFGDYSPTVTISGGTNTSTTKGEVSSTLNDDHTLDFANNKEKIPETGIKDSNMPYQAFGVVLLMFVGYIIVSRKLNSNLK